MRTLTIDQFLTELYEVHEGDMELFDHINDFTQDVARMRALAEVINARPLPSEWPEFE